MSFGDDKSSNPISGMMGGLMSQFDSVFGSIFGKKGDAPQVPKSLVNAPTPESTDTPGRHKTLLGQ